jgi:hypothetical protein
MYSDNILRAQGNSRGTRSARRKTIAGGKGESRCEPSGGITLDEALRKEECQVQDDASTYAERRPSVRVPTEGGHPSEWVAGRWAFFSSLINLRRSR